MKYLDLLTVGMPLLAASLYALASIGFFIKKDISWGIVWASYALANIALVFTGGK